MSKKSTPHEPRETHADPRQGILIRPLKWTLLAGALTAQQAAAESPGERIAQKGADQPGAVSCASCHGIDGGGNEQSGFPRLAGLDAAYIENQLLAFKQGHRTNPVMAGMAAPLTDQDIQDVAAYYAGLSAVSHARAPAGVSAAAGEQLARYGDMPNRGLPACLQCHGPGGAGVGKSFPPLAGQPYSYILAQLKAWKTGTRSGEPLGLMQAVAAKLTDAESESVAAYLATQPVATENRPADKQGSGQVVTTSAAKLATAGNNASAVAPPHQGEVEPGRAPGAEGYFQPPVRGAWPEGKMGDMVRLGEAMFSATNTHTLSARYVGNKQVCSGCHLDAGRLANSAPMWASWVAYPAYRKKNDKVNTFIERIQGCFTYSMNAQASAAGHAPDADSDVIIGLVSYVYWLASGAPTGDQHMPGRGVVKLAEPTEGFDPTRGATVYTDKCAVCHGEQGEGQFAAGQPVFPPLWGPDAYNWGAGMHNIRTAAGFIKLNMPFGLADPVQKKALLSDQEAWDVAAWVNSQERPQDPRFNGDLAETTKKFHDGRYDYYGKRKHPDGRLLGDDAALR
jgi:thiosulfate dehydrogenase